MRPVVIGIAGGSASGKTTLSNAVAERLRGSAQAIEVKLMPMDRYFYRGERGGPVFVSPSSGESLPDNNVPGSADNELLVADLLQEKRWPDRADVVIVEGLMALHVDAVHDLLDLKVFVELEADVRALRRLLRDMKGGRGSTDPEWIATYYRECARVGHQIYVEPSRARADVIVRGDADIERTARVISHIARGLQSDC